MHFDWKFDPDYGLPLDENGDFDGEKIFGCEPDDFFYITRQPPEHQWDTPIPERELQRYVEHGIAIVPLPRIKPQDLWAGYLGLKPLINIARPEFYWKRDRSILYKQRRKIREIPARIYIASSKVRLSNLPQDRARRFSDRNELQALEFSLSQFDRSEFWDLDLSPIYV